MSTCPYDICDGSGFRYDEDTNTASDCRCRPQTIARNRARSLSAVIPRRYQDVGFDRYPINEVEPELTVARTREYVARIDEHLDAGRGLWFMGGVGTGKTALAMLVTKTAIERGRSAARYTLPGLLSRIRMTFDNGQHSDLLEQLTAVDLLHIDDIGAEQTTPWVLEELYTIVNSRYEEQKSMVITTNINDYKVLGEQITERTVSRLIEMCDELPVLGHDRRMDGPGDRDGEPVGYGRSIT
jgi:DNA replication protein DnaC